MAQTPIYFAVFKDYIVTADENGMVPLNSQIIAALDHGGAAHVIVKQANLVPALLAALEAMVESCACTNGCSLDDMTCATNLARVALSLAKQVV